MRSTSTLSQISLLLFLVAILTGPIILGGTRPWIFIPPFLLLGIITLIGIYRMLKASRSGSWKPDLIDYSVVTFVMYAIGRYFFSITEYDSRIEILKIMAYAITFFFCRYGLERRIQGMTILFSILICGFGLSIFGFILKANPEFHPYGETFHIYYSPRLISTFGCPNHIGYFLVMSTSIALAIGFFSSLSWVVRITVLYSTIPMMIALALTLSRGSWIAMVFALLAITIAAVRLGKVRRWIPITILILLILGAGTYITLNKDLNHRVFEGFDPKTMEVSPQYVRVQLFIDSLKIFNDYPLWGTGPATFLYVHPRYQGPTYPSLAVFNHNDYTNALTDYGLIGLLLILLFVVTVSVKLSRNPQKEETPQDRIFLISAAASLSALIFHSFVEFNLHITANALVFFALVGLGLRKPTPLNHQVVPTSKNIFTWISLALAAVGLFFFLKLLLKTSQGYYPLLNHQRQAENISFSSIVSELEEAFQKDPQSTPLATTLGDLYRLEASKNKENEIRYPLAAQSIHWYQVAQQLNPIDDTITMRLAMSFDLMERYMEAYQCYREVLINQPYSGYFWVEFATHYWRQGLLGKAREAYEAALACPYRPKNILTELTILDELIQKALQAKKQIESEKTTSPTEPSQPSS